MWFLVCLFAFVFLFLTNVSLIYLLNRVTYKQKSKIYRQVQSFQTDFIWAGGGKEGGRENQRDKLTIELFQSDVEGSILSDKFGSWKKQ